MGKKFCVYVFGKAGCDKCKILNQRLDDLLTKPEWADFEKHYLDVLTVDGVVGLCKVGGVNPQRIPAFVVAAPSPEGGRFDYLPPLSDVAAADMPVAARLHSCLGLQTDYSDAGRGVISPRMITTVLGAASQR